MAYVPSPHSKAADRASEEAFMRRKPVAKPAAKPTVKAVRDESRAKKAATVEAKSTGKLGESMMARTEAARGKASMSPAPFSKGKGSPAAPAKGTNLQRVNTAAKGNRLQTVNTSTKGDREKKGINPPGTEMFKRSLEFGRPAQAEAFRKPSNYTENTFAKLKRKTKALFSN